MRPLLYVGFETYLINDQERRLLSSPELEASNTFEPLPNTIYWFEFPVGDVPAFLHVSEEWLAQHGYRERILSLRKLLLHKDVQERFKQICDEHTSEYTKKHGSVYEYGVSFQPGYGPGRAQLCALARAAAQTYGNVWMTELVDLANEVAEEWFNDTREGGLEQYILQHASLLPGSGQRKRFSSCQVNYARPDKGLPSLKKFGDVHPDKHDHPAFLTGMFDLSHFGPDDFGGRFNVLPFGAGAPMKGCSLTFFSARFYHCATGYGEYTVGKESPFRLPTSDSDNLSSLDPSTHPYTRLTIPIYPDMRMMEPSYRWFNVEMYGKGAMKFFTTREQHHLWMMSLYIIQEPGIRSNLGAHDDDDSDIDGTGPARLIVATNHDINVTLGKRIVRRRAQKNYYDALRDNGPDSISRVVPPGYQPTDGDSDLDEPQARVVPPSFKEVREFRKIKQIIVDQSENAHGITRNGDPDFYARLFSYEEITAATTDLLVKRATEVLDLLDAPNPEYDSMMKDVESLDCGSHITSEMVKITHSRGDTKVDWNSETFHIPSNPRYVCCNVKKDLEIEATRASIVVPYERVLAAVHDVSEAANSADKVASWTPLDDLTRANLRMLCESEGLKILPGVKRNELKDMLRAHFNGEKGSYVDDLDADLE